LRFLLVAFRTDFCGVFHISPRFFSGALRLFGNALVGQFLTPNGFPNCLPNVTHRVLDFAGYLISRHIVSSAPYFQGRMQNCDATHFIRAYLQEYK
jgi:hypothetical protein